MSLFGERAIIFYILFNGFDVKTVRYLIVETKQRLPERLSVAALSSNFALIL
jgi:hypothetical protein